MALEQEDIQDLVEALKGGTKNTRQVQQELAQRAKGIEQYKKLNDELIKQVKANKLDNKIQEDLQKAYANNIKSLEANIKVQKDIAQVGKRLTDSLFGLGDASVRGADTFQYYTKSLEGFPILGPLINEFGSSLDFNVDVFKSLASLGADFGQSLVNLRIGSRDALLPLLEFTDLVRANSTDLALLFGTVNQGTAQLSNLSREVRTNLLPQFASFGVTTDELNEFLTTFLTLQRIQGRQDFLSQEATTSALQSYTGELDKVAKLTGIQRQELDKAVRAQQADAVLQSFLAGLAPDRKAEVETFIAGLQQLSPALGGAVSNILATGFPLGEFEQNLVALNPGLMDSIQAFKDGSLSTGQFNNRIREIAGSTDRFGSQLLRANPAVNEVVTALLPLRGSITDLTALQLERAIVEGGATGEIIELQESFRRFKAQIEGVQTTLLQQTLPTLAQGFGMSAKTLDTFGGAITKFGLDYPATLTAAVIGAQTLRYGANFAAEVGLNAAGVAAGIRLSGLGGGVLGRTGRFAGAAGRTALRAAPVAGAAIGVGLNSYELMDDNPDNNKRAILGLIGATAGGLLGLIGGPMGVAIGATIGSAAGNALGSMIEPRAIGGDVVSGQPYLVGERGPELFSPNQDGAITSNADLALQTAEMSKLSTQFGTQNDSFKQFMEMSTKMEKHLNTLVAINARTETHTGSAAKRLANMGDNLV